MAAAKRRRRQAERERRTLHERERAGAAPATRPERESAALVGKRRPARVLSDYEQWLSRPKNLSGRAFAQARGLVRVRNPEGTVELWRERAEVEALLEGGWVLA